MNDLNESSPLAIQPAKIITTLKPHQLATLYKAMQLEQEHNIEYKEGDTLSKITVNIGLLGDLVGYGKTLSALAIIANNEIQQIHTNDLLTSSYTNCDIFHNNRYTFNSMTITRNVVNMPTTDDYINTTLVIVPRGPVYTQWVTTLKEQTKLKYLAIDNVAFIHKHLLKKTEKTTFNDIKSYFESFDLVLIKNTTLNNLINEYLNFDNNIDDENSSQDSRCSSKCLIKRCLGFEMNVFVYDPFVSAEKIESFGGKKVDDLKEAVKTMDAISLHIPLNDETKNMINLDLLKTMKKNCIIINKYQLSNRY